jgi:hypothetical protein
MWRLIGALAGLAVLLAIFWDLLNSDPALTEEEVWLNVAIAAFALGLAAAAQELTRRSGPFERRLASLGVFPGVVVLILSLGLLGSSSVNVVGPAVLCLGILGGTLVTLGRPARASVSQ